MDGASGVPILEVCPFLDKIQMIENTEAGQQFMSGEVLMRGFQVMEKKQYSLQKTMEVYVS